MEKPHDKTNYNHVGVLHLKLFMTGALRELISFQINKEELGIFIPSIHILTKRQNNWIK
jgi:hypothetical protein